MRIVRHKLLVRSACCSCRGRYRNIAVSSCQRRRRYLDPVVLSFVYRYTIFGLFPKLFRKLLIAIQTDCNHFTIFHGYYPFFRLMMPQKWKILQNKRIWSISAKNILLEQLILIKIDTICLKLYLFLLLKYLAINFIL